MLARKGAERWHVAGINGTAEEKALTLNLDDLPVHGSGTLITDGDSGDLSFRQSVMLDGAKRLAVKLAPRGGFVMTLE